MANLNLNPKEILALYEMLSYPRKAHVYDEGCECCGAGTMQAVIKEEDPMDSITRKVKELLVLGIENLEIHGMKAKLGDWLEQEEVRIARLRKEQLEVNKGMRDIRDTFVAKKDPVSKVDIKGAKKVFVDAELEAVRKAESVFEDVVITSLKSDSDLTRELNEDKEFKYPKPNAPRPVMPQHNKFRGKHKK